ncbi:HlyD family secretion protein [Pseudoroseomonas aestuarii]|uniref:HlyD family secretion protein n=1 Tax=Teichococcus aestuarii TaxID=568898 RepID=A0A2U1V163_9PROT|nr:HlyD family secretion protein [Pseudoroseomonas aestuarii]
MKRRFWIVPVAAGLAAVLAALVVWPADPPPAPATTPAPVGVGALGRVEPASRIRRLGVPGGMSVTRLARLLVVEGDTVEEGQLLAELADAEQKAAQLRQAEAALAEAERQMALVQAAGRPEEIDAQRARLEALRAVEASARRDALRAEQLVPSGAGGQAEAERRRFAAARASAEAAEAEAVLARLRSARPEDLAVAEAQIWAAQARLRVAQADLALSRLYAPIAGTVLSIHARPGDRIGEDGLLELADLRQMEVVADVYETDLPRLRLGQPAEIIVPGEAQRLSAVLTEIGWQVRRTVQAGTDPVAAVDARTVSVRLRLDEAGAALLRRRSNMQVQVAIRP